jgi:hypothetical protein
MLTSLIGKKPVLVEVKEIATPAAPMLGICTLQLAA